MTYSWYYKGVANWRTIRSDSIYIHWQPRPPVGLTSRFGHILVCTPMSADLVKPHDSQQSTPSPALPHNMHTNAVSSPSHHLSLAGTSMMALPQDVFNLVIDELGRLPDVKTLRACSMTCSSFRCPSQSHIFRRVDLGRRTPRKKYFHRFASHRHVR